MGLPSIPNCTSVINKNTMFNSCLIIMIPKYTICAYFVFGMKKLNLLYFFTHLIFIHIHETLKWMFVIHHVFFNFYSTHNSIGVKLVEIICITTCTMATDPATDDPNIGINNQIVTFSTCVLTFFMVKNLICLLKKETTTLTIIKLYLAKLFFKL